MTATIHDENPAAADFASAAADIPTEVWLACFSHCDTASLAALSLTNTYFYNICADLRFSRPFVFEIGAVGEADALAYMQRKKQHLLDLAASPYAGQIQTMAFDSVIGTFGSRQATTDEKQRRLEGYQALEKTFVEMLPAFQGLKEITVCGVRGDAMESFGQALEHLPALEELNFRAADLLQAPTRLSLKNVSLNAPARRDIPFEANRMDYLDPQTLRSLTLSQAYIAPIFRALLHAARPLEQLTEIDLVLNNTDLPLLLELFAWLPNLHSASIYLIASGTAQLDTLPPVPATHLPRLTTLVAPAPLAALIAPGHPITALRLVGGYSACWEDPGPRAVLPALAQTSVPVKTLSLTSYNLAPGPGTDTVDVLNSLARAFPALEKLDIEWDETAYGLKRAVYPEMFDDAAKEVPSGFGAGERSGFRYDIDNDAEYAPPESTIFAQQEQTALELVLSSLNETLRLPSTLKSIVFLNSLRSTAHEHAAILTLEKLHPAFEEIEFGGWVRDSRWARTGRMWENFAAEGAADARLKGEKVGQQRFRIVSSVVQQSECTASA
ncbi:hypothetical protein MKEN_01110600 [Mycena kentingensis (nom. inval.)]|nr:hypothetical protein MKEN_01110600 [Mycena kentingensis (nom. inval.)]